MKLQGSDYFWEFDNQINMLKAYDIYSIKIHHYYMLFDITPIEREANSDKYDEKFTSYQKVNNIAPQFVNNKIYFLGIYGTKRMNFVVKFCESSMLTAKRIATRHSDKDIISAIPYQNYIYIFTNGNFITSPCICEKYDISKDKWLYVPSPFFCQPIRNPIIAGTYLYTFISGKHYAGLEPIAVYRLDLLDEDKGWECFAEYPNIALYGYPLIQKISEAELLILNLAGKHDHFYSLKLDLNQNCTKTWKSWEYNKNKYTKIIDDGAKCFIKFRNRKFHIFARKYFCDYFTFDVCTNKWILKRKEIMWDY